MTIPTKLRKKLRLSETAKREHVVPRTIMRWLERHEETGFPQPVIIFGRFYFYEDELDLWDEKHPNFGPAKKQSVEPQPAIVAPVKKAAQS